MSFDFNCRQSGECTTTAQRLIGCRALTSIIATVAVVAALTVTGCDTLPGAVDTDLRPPVVSDLSFSPDEVDLGSVDPADLADNLIDVDLSVAVSVQDPDGDLQSVSFILQPPLRSEEPIAFGELSPTSGDRYHYGATVSLPVGQVGNYTVLVYAQDSEGQLSNDVRGLLKLSAEQGFGDPPVVAQVEATPNPVIPPTVLTIVAEVSDPQGLSNILRVEIRTPNGLVFNMVDDGESLGDEVDGDGLYTASFDVPVGIEAGVQVFEIQAFDRNGNASNIVQRPVTIQ